LYTAFVVIANKPDEQTELIDAAVSWLSQRLPENWGVERLRESNTPVQPPGSDYARLMIRGNTGGNNLIVVAKPEFQPKEVNILFAGLSRGLLMYNPNVPILIVAPWLSRRTRELLAAERLNYIDLTGNALVRLDNPALYIQTEGANRDPTPRPRGRTTLRGARAARLIRLLIDVRPPYGVREIANAAQLNAGYVSQLLETLEDEALIERSRRGRVESIDIAALLRRWAEWYDVLKTNDSAMFVARAGLPKFLTQLAEAPGTSRILITGSFAARRLAPVAAPALLAAYCDDLDTAQEEFDLFNADEGANVALLQPFDRVVWERTTTEEGIEYAAPSQVVVDCLTGNGRMPAEGEALLEWITLHESSWRLGSLTKAMRT
jgi:hypothetical protein